MILLIVVLHILCFVFPVQLNVNKNSHTKSSKSVNNLQLREFISEPTNTRIFPDFDKSSLYVSSAIVVMLGICQVRIFQT